MAVLCLIIAVVAPVYAVKSTYIIGAVFDVTGPGSPLGTPERDTARMVEQLINKQGGIGGHPVKFIYADNSSEEGKCVMSVKKMLDSDKVKVIIGPSTTGTTLAVAGICERSRVPIVSCAAGNKITTPARPYIFKTAQADTHAIAKVIDYLKSKKLTRIAFLNDSNAFGKSGLEQMNLQATKSKITLVAVESFGGKDPSMSAQLTRIKSKKPQALVVWGTNPGPAIIVREARQLGLRMPVVMSHGVANKKFIELAGSAANGVVLPAGKLTVASQIPSSDPQKKVLLQYQSLFQKTYHRDADAFGGYAWDAAQLVTRAMKKAGDNPAKIRAEIERTKNFVGVSGVFNFSAKDHNGLGKSAFVMVKVDKGGFKLVK